MLPFFPIVEEKPQKKQNLHKPTNNQIKKDTTHFILQRVVSKNPNPYTKPICISSSHHTETSTLAPLYGAILQQKKGTLQNGIGRKVFTF